jgi:hypothetical protein
MKLTSYVIAVLLSVSVVSCYETDYPEDRFYDTKWSASETGGVYNPDDNSQLLYSYRFEHELSLGNKSFVHVIHRYIRQPGTTGYSEYPDSVMTGFFSVLYPAITLTTTANTCSGNFLDLNTLEVQPVYGQVISFTRE